jgi:hypothetical protein
MMNESRKARRSLSRRRGEKRKEERRQAQAEREAVNRELRKKNRPTPWEITKIGRRNRRDSNPRVRKRRRELIAETLGGKT